MLQSYKKRVKCKRKACFSFHSRVQSNFGEAKVTKKREQNKANPFIFMLICCDFFICQKDFMAMRGFRTATHYFCTSIQIKNIIV